MLSDLPDSNPFLSPKTPVNWMTTVIIYIKLHSAHRRIQLNHVSRVVPTIIIQICLFYLFKNFFLKISVSISQIHKPLTISGSLGYSSSSISQVGPSSYPRYLTFLVLADSLGHSNSSISQVGPSSYPRYLTFLI